MSSVPIESGSSGLDGGREGADVVDGQDREVSGVGGDPVQAGGAERQSGWFDRVLGIGQWWTGPNRLASKACRWVLHTVLLLVGWNPSNPLAVKPTRCGRRHGEIPAVLTVNGRFTRWASMAARDVVVGNLLAVTRTFRHGAINQSVTTGPSSRISKPTLHEAYAT